MRVNLVDDLVVSCKLQHNHPVHSMYDLIHCTHKEKIHTHRHTHTRTHTHTHTLISVLNPSLHPGRAVFNPSCFCVAAKELPKMAKRAIPLFHTLISLF